MIFIKKNLKKYVVENKNSIGIIHILLCIRYKKSVPLVKVCVFNRDKDSRDKTCDWSKHSLLYITQKNIVIVKLTTNTDNNENSFIFHFRITSPDNMYPSLKHFVSLYVLIPKKMHCNSFLST